MENKNNYLTTQPLKSKVPFVFRMTKDNLQWKMLPFHLLNTFFSSLFLFCLSFLYAMSYSVLYIT